MEKTRQLERLQQDWRGKLQTGFWYMVALTFCMEIFIVIVRIVYNSFPFDNVIGELVRSIILPTLFNVLISIIVKFRNSSKTSEREKNRAYVYGTMGIASVIVCFHGYFIWTLCIFVLPIIVSVIFADRVLTRRSLWVGIIIMYASVVTGRLFDDFWLAEHLVNATLNTSFMLFVYFVCNQIVAFLEQKNEIIKDYNESNELLNHELTLDPMTSLYNHKEFRRVLDSSYAVCRTEESVMTIVVVDIDFFKRVNDNYGHEQGDKVLISVADQLKAFCSEDGKVFRYGGEEFAVVFMNKTADYALEIMEKLRENVSKIKYDFMPKDKNVTISIGIYEYSGKENLSVHEIFTFADGALYEAKNSGRNRCCVHR